MTVETDIDALVSSTTVRKDTAVASKAQLTAHVADSLSARDQASSAATSTLAIRDEASGHATAASAVATASVGATAYADMSAVLASKGVTAVDVFVYDTSLDSDGGAWRYRTTGTSWYNETLNTATRGSRREFPAVAVIVAEVNRVTIYDGDDPSLPMWMVFNRRSTSSADGFMSRESVTNAISDYIPGGVKLSAVNGYLGIAAVRGLDIANFPVDTLSRYSPNNYASGGVENGVISRDNTTSYFSASLPSIASGDSRVDTVHFRVSDKAPKNEAGLPIPHVFVGAETARVFDIATEAVSGDLGDRIIAVNENGTAFIESRDEDSTFATSTGGFSFAATGSGGNSTSSFKYNGTLENPTYSSAFSDQNSTTNDVDWNRSGTLSRVVLDPTNLLNTVWCRTTNTYNTGWMTRLTKGAFLSDTDDTDLVGGELVTNGMFATDLSGWTVTNTGGASVVWDETQAMSMTATTEDAFADYPVTLEAGKRYKLSFEIMNSGGVHVTVDGPTQARSLYVFSSGAGVKTYYLTANEASNTINFREIFSGNTLIANVSLRLVDADRSVNNNSLIVNGTITRTPVATGADLVGYSGFSASNYLSQPYNSALDFGTGDFCVMGWIKPNGILGSDYILHRYDFGVSGFAVYANVNEGLGFETPFQYFQYGKPLLNNSWSFACITRSGGTAFMYVNGTQVNSISNGANLSASESLLVGVDKSLANPFSGTLALWRISATAPTAEQIAKIYEDERHLFQPGAKCTLYGSSNGVTALAHDPVTNLLHVGTSAGRSVFDGLVRVDNTTTAVGTSISAVNGLVVEE